MPQTPEERAGLVEAIAERQQAEHIPISEDAYRLWAERDKAVDAMESATNRQERDQAEAVFLKIHKDFLRALGMKPCEARDCTKYLTGRQAKYCSVECRTKDKARRWRASKPGAKRGADLKYLRSLEKADLKKTTKPSRKPKRGQLVI